MMYNVSWAIEVDAENAAHAAVEALARQKDPDGIASIFRVQPADRSAPAQMFDADPDPASKAPPIELVDPSIAQREALLRTGRDDAGIAAVLEDAASRLHSASPALASNLRGIGLLFQQSPVTTDDVVHLVASIRTIVANWERGDLAFAVNTAEALADDVAMRLPDSIASMLVSADEETSMDAAAGGPFPA
ncbi:MAG: hypothetical protein ABIW82_16950 [Dokdonella sp.]